jgi:hypothetical protein
VAQRDGDRSRRHWRCQPASGAEKAKNEVGWGGPALVKTGEGRWAKAKGAARMGGLMG